MLSLYKLKPGNADYYLAKVRYYLGDHPCNVTFADINKLREHNGPPPYFFGGGAEALGLTNMVPTEELALKLFKGEDWRKPLKDDSSKKRTSTTKSDDHKQPTESNKRPRAAQKKSRPKPNKLTQNAGGKNHVSGYDLCFSEPKSISLAAVHDRRVEGFHQQAVEATLIEIEEKFCRVRIGKAGKDLREEKAKATFMPLQEIENREGEAHLHTHGVWYNFGVCPDGQTRALVGKHIYGCQLYAGAFARAQMAHLMTQEGARFERDGRSMKLLGVPEEVCEENSTRRKQIVSKLAERGASSAHAAEIANFDTRKPKRHDESREETLARMARDLTKQGFSAKDAAKCFKHGPPQPPPPLRVIIDTALQNLLKELQHFSKLDLITETLLELPQYGISPLGLESAFERYFKTNPEVVPLRSEGGEQKYTTKSVLEYERKLFQRVDKLVARKRRPPNKAKIARFAKKYKLTPKQVRALRKLVEDDRSISFFKGRAGTGKTSRVLAAYVDLLRDAGNNPVGVSTAAIAADNLASETGIETLTTAKFLNDFDVSWGFWLKHEAKQYAKTLQGKKGR